MSKNIKGKNLDININITQAGTMNADIFNAYQDFTLNGVSIVNRIATNEGDIALLNSEVITLQSEINTNETDIATNTSDILDLQTDKQDTLTFDSTPTAGSINPVTSQGIKSYVDSSTPSITATAPINYSGGVISGTFDNAPTNGSVNFLSSDKVYDALALKQDLITASTNITCDALTASSLSTTGSLLMTGGSSQISNAGAYNGTGNIVTSGNIIGTDFITNSGTNILTKINTKQDLITASTALTCGNISTTAITNNPVINSGAINCNANITTASNITCGGDLTAIGTGNDIDLRNNLIAGAGVSLTQTGNNTTINNTATGTSQLYYFKATSNQNSDQAFSSVNFLANFNQILYNVPSGYDIGNKRYVVPVAGTYQFFFQAFQNSASTGGFRLGIFQNNNLMGMTGASVANTERCGVIIECAVGDGISVRWVSGSGVVYMSNLHSWFEGYLLAGSSQLSTSQQYYFRVGSSSSGNYTPPSSSGTILPFNSIVYDVPSTAGNRNFDIATSRYTIPVDGTYKFSYHLYFQDYDSVIQVMYFVDGVREGGLFAGDTSGLVESASILIECIAGQIVDVRTIYVSSSPTTNINMGVSWFEGFLLQAHNNTITDTTNLTTNSITTLTGNIISGGDIETSSGNFLVSNSGNVECGDLQAENLIINTNLNSETFIRTVAIAKIESNGANTKVVNCSVSRTNVGRYTFTFSSPRPTANYVINITITENAVILDDIIVQVVQGTQTANGFNYFIHEQDNGGTAGTYRDRASFISVFDTD